MPEDTGVAVAEAPAFVAPAVEEAQGQPIAVPDQPAPAEEPTDAAPTEDAPAETAPSIADLLKNLSEDELAELPEVKSLVARRGESARQRAERETTTKLFAQQQQHVGSQEFRDAMRQAVAAAADGTGEVDQAKLDEMSSGLMSHGAHTAVTVLAQLLSEETGKDFALTAEEKELSEAAQVRYMQNPLDPSPLFRAWLKPYLRARSEATTTEAVTAADKAGYDRGLKEGRAQAQVETAKKAQTDRKAEPGVTPIAGGGSKASYTSQREIDRAHAAGRIETNEYMALRTNGTYAGLPW